MKCSFSNTKQNQENAKMDGHDLDINKSFRYAGSIIKKDIMMKVTLIG